jgi:hypothetical protein
VLDLSLTTTLEGIQTADMSQPAEDTLDDPPANAPGPFSNADADIILRSCDGSQFRVHKLLLYLVSPIFKDMLAIPQPQSLCGDKSELPVVDLTETGSTIRKLLHLCYPAIFDSPDASKSESLSEVTHLIEATTKYEIQSARKAALQLLIQPRFLDSAPLRVYATARRFRAEKEARLAAAHLLRRPLLQDESPADLEAIDYESLYHLVLYHKRCTVAASRVAFDHIWIHDGLYSWINCEDDFGTNITEISKGRKRKKTIEVPAHAWWIEFMLKTQDALSRAVSVVEIADRETLAALSIEAAECSLCRPNVARELPAFMDAFQKEIRRTISQVRQTGELNEVWVSPTYKLFGRSIWIWVSRESSFHSSLDSSRVEISSRRYAKT